MVIGKIDYNRPNSALMAITFDSETQLKITFSENFHHYLSSDIYFAWFRGRPNFPILVMTPLLRQRGQISEKFFLYSGRP